MLTQEEIQSAIINGLIDAASEYIIMSGGLPVTESGIEQALSYCVGKSIWNKAKKKDGGGFVTLETNFSDLEDWSKTRKPLRGRRAKAISHNGRVDIAYYDKNENLIGIVELKRWFDFSVIEKDVERVFRLLKRLKSSTIRWGCLAAPVHIWDNKVAEQKAEKIAQKIRENFTGIDVKASFLKRDVGPDSRIERDKKILKSIGAASFFVRLRKQ